MSLGLKIRRACLGTMLVRLLTNYVHNYLQIQYFFLNDSAVTTVNEGQETMIDLTGCGLLQGGILRLALTAVLP